MYFALKKTIQSKHYLQFLSIKKKTLNFHWKIHSKKKIQLKNGSFQLSLFMSSRHYRIRLDSV